mgnify:CR=1 FL=1
MLMLGLITGCDARPAAPADASAPSLNLLRNPSFEDETITAWFDFHERNPKQWGAMGISEQRAHTGERSALLTLDSDGSTERARVLGVVQEISGVACPERLSGWYFVEGWERGAEKQYLQVVVIAYGGETPEGMTNYQVARTLAGVTSNPLPTLKNRRFAIGGPPEPVQGAWVFFEFGLASLFEDKWGLVPGEDASLRVFFEVRYDDRRPGDPPARARVWFDDLRLGSPPSGG